MERPTLERLRDALSGDGSDSGPDLWPAIRAGLEPSRPVGNGAIWGIRAGFALAAAVILVLLVGTLTTDRGEDAPRLEIQMIDVAPEDVPTGDAARDEAARLLDAERPTFLESPALRDDSDASVEDR